MKKLLASAAIAALFLGWSQPGHSQTATTQSGATSGAGAQAIAGGSMGIGTLVVPGNTGGVGGVQTLWTLGIAPPASAATSYDACLKNVGISAIAGALSIPLEISHCWELRDMEAMAKFPPGSVQYEHGCRDSSWLNTDWVSGTMACTSNKAKLAKTNPNDPRARPVAATPVVMPGMTVTGGSPPPTVVPVNNSTQMSEVAPINYSRRCNPRAGIVEQCTQF